MNITNSRTAAPSRLRSDGSAVTSSSYDNDPPPPPPTDASLILRPANFGDPERLAPPLPAPPLPVPSSHMRKRRELIELAGNPFVPDLQTSSSSRADGQAAAHFRQDRYPAYDASGRRIGLNHVRNPSTSLPTDSKGYYRKHVHEYGTPRNADASASSSRPSQQPHHSQSFPLEPLIPQRQASPQFPPPQSLLPPSYPPQPSHPPQATVQGNRYQEHGPLPPVSAVIAGIPPDSQFGIGIGSFSHIQNRPRTPHEILGLPQGAPLNLWSLADPEAADAKPQYNYHVLVKLAILGNKDQKATLQDILRAIRLRFPYYAKLPKQEAVAFGNSIRHLLSLLAAFVREPKPVTEPGKGSYWKVDFSKGEGNKRIRKRNKPQKKTDDSDVRSLDYDNGNEKPQEKQPDNSKEKQESRSDSDDSEQSGSPSTETLITSASPYARSPAETWLAPASAPLPPLIPRPIGKGGRKPAPKNLAITPNGETTTIPTELPAAPYNEHYEHIHMDPGGPASGTSRPQPFLQLRPDNHDVGVRRDHMVRGTNRSAPYPPPRAAIPNGRTSSESESITSERRYRQSNIYPETNRYEYDQNVTTRLTNGSRSVREQQYDRREVIPNNGIHNGYAYNQHYSSNNGGTGRYDSISPLDSPASNQSNLSPDPTNPHSRLNGSTSHSHAHRKHAGNLSNYASFSSRMPYKATAAITASSASDEFIPRSRMNHYRSPPSSSSSSSMPNVGSLGVGMMSFGNLNPNSYSSAPVPYEGHRNPNTTHSAGAGTVQSAAGTGVVLKPPPSHYPNGDIYTHTTKETPNL